VVAPWAASSQARASRCSPVRPGRADEEGEGAGRDSISPCGVGVEVDSRVRPTSSQSSQLAAWTPFVRPDGSCVNHGPFCLGWADQCRLPALYASLRPIKRSSYLCDGMAASALLTIGLVFHRRPPVMWGHGTHVRLGRVQRRLHPHGSSTRRPRGLNTRGLTGTGAVSGPSGPLTLADSA